MLKCKICGTEFPAIKERHYIATNDVSTLVLSPLLEKEERKLYNCFDCPMGGSQVVAQERKRKLNL